MSAAARNCVSSAWLTKAVLKHYAPIDAERPASRLESQATCLAFTLDDMRMRRTEHDLDRVGMSRENLGERIHDVLDALVS